MKNENGGTHLLAGVKNVGVNNILLTEGLSVWEGPQIALEDGFKNVQVEGDAKMLTNYINGSFSTQEDFKPKKKKTLDDCWRHPMTLKSQPYLKKSHLITF